MCLALQSGVKDAITPSAGIPNTSENYLIFEMSKHAVYWKAVFQSTPKAICHFFFLSTGGQNKCFCRQCVCPAMGFFFFQNLSVMATVATWGKAPWKKTCRGSDVGPGRGTERSGRLWHAGVKPSFLSTFYCLLPVNSSNVELLPPSFLFAVDSESDDH